MSHGQRSSTSSLNSSSLITFINIHLIQNPKRFPSSRFIKKKSFTSQKENQTMNQIKVFDTVGCTVVRLWTIKCHGQSKQFGLSSSHNSVPVIA